MTTLTHAPLRIRLGCPDVGTEELEAVREVLSSGILTNGPQNAAFEAEFAERHQVPHGVTFANGTTALTAMLLAEGIGPGDEVIVPAMTFISTATAVLHVGATPVFADIEPETFALDPEDVSARITSRTQAVLTVHYAGQPGRLHELAALCADAGILLLEDAAQAAGAAYRNVPVGGFGHCAMFSFTPTKNITTGEGGMVLTGDGSLAERLRLLRNHGQSRLYRHDSLGFNWRLSELHAALGRVQLTKLDRILTRKRSNAATLAGLLAAVSGVAAPRVAEDCQPVHTLYTCLVDRDRDRVLDALLAAGIEARVYFPPVHKQPIFPDSPYLPVTEALAARMLSLPFHSKLTEDELAEIAQAVRDAVG